MAKILIDNPVLARSQQRVALMTVTVPMLGAAAALYWALTRGISVTTVAVCVPLYLLTTAGLTVGFHRLFTHKSFKPNVLVKAVLAILGMMAAQGPLLFWVASHRRHHAFSDTRDDCHSPCTHGAGLSGTIRGLWHAHFGWMLKTEVTNVPMFARDILQDDLVMLLNRYYLLWVLLGLAIPAGVGAISPGGWEGAMEGILWGGLFRICFVHQITWGLNSLNHVFGRRRYKSEDNSRNIGWLALITMGEGWHNNHHAYPGSARFGHAWWELDIGYGLIRLLQLCGLCTDVCLPDRNALAKKQAASFSNVN
ncbi:acyl-CoA desaturase [Paraburkholderia sp. 35.1]|uniref:acyl-CoA desaturase n=1 Tax=unclassified Paraburkholderia TaxID=2615204 RepID=UPI003D216CED